MKKICAFLVFSFYIHSAPTRVNESALHLACAKMDVTAVESLIKQGDNPNSLNSFAEIPLHRLLRQKITSKNFNNYTRILTALINSNWNQLDVYKKSPANLFFEQLDKQTRCCALFCLPINQQLTNDEIAQLTGFTLRMITIQRLHLEFKSFC